MNDYEAKREARIERYLNRASRAEKESGAAWNGFKSVADCIPCGQPVLVGHHSERRHRRDLARMDRYMAKMSDLSSKAQYWRSRAASAASNDAIYSDDPDAVEKLREKIAGLEKRQAVMKSVNAAHKKGKLADLVGAEKAAELVKRMQSYDRQPYPSYSLSNNNANIRRLKERLARLEKIAAAPEADPVKGNGVEVLENPVNGRLELRFAGKPAADIIARMKAAYFCARRKDGEWFWMGRMDSASRQLASELSGGAYPAPKNNPAP